MPITQLPPCNSISFSPVLLYLLFLRFPSPLLSRLLGGFRPQHFFFQVFQISLAFPFSCFGCSCLNLGFLLHLNFLAGVEVGLSPWAVHAMFLHHELCPLPVDHWKVFSRFVKDPAAKHTSGSKATCVHGFPRPTGHIACAASQQCLP